MAAANGAQRSDRIDPLNDPRLQYNRLRSVRGCHDWLMTYLSFMFQCHYFTEFDKIDDEVYRRWLERVPEFRRSLAQSFKRRQDAVLSLASYLLLERALSRRGHEFYWNEFGKPYLMPQLSQGPPPFFSFSHTDGMAVCCFAETEVGVDVERIADVKDELAGTICTVKERRFLDRSGNPGYHLARFWVLKESYFKALGHGLSLDPRSVDFSGSFPHEFAFETFSDVPGYLAAVCRRGNEAVCRWSSVRFEELE